MFKSVLVNGAAGPVVPFPVPRSWLINAPTPIPTTTRKPPIRAKYISQSRSLGPFRARTIGVVPWLLGDSGAGAGATGGAAGTAIDGAAARAIGTATGTAAGVAIGGALG
jgi:hypothetical protein